jgi:hypothetical protein
MCDAKCQASCSGRCDAKATAQCQIDCQAKLEGGCEADLSGGCKAHCSDPNGALFCDGNYVDTGNNLQNCIDALNAILNVKVTASASGNCSGSTCQGQANASASCAASPGSTDAAPLAPLGIAALAAAVVGARARRRAKG